MALQPSFPQTVLFEQPAPICPVSRHLKQRAFSFAISALRSTGRPWNCRHFGRSCLPSQHGHFSGALDGRVVVVLNTFGLLGRSTVCCAVGPKGLVLRPITFLAASNPSSQSASVIIVGFTGHRLYTFLAQSSVSRGGIFATVRRRFPTLSTS